MEYVRLDKYCKEVKDGTHDTPKPTDLGKPLVTSKAINRNSIDFAQTYNISLEDFDKINKRSLVEQWDVLMTMIGSVGRLLLVKERPDYAIKNIALFKVQDECKAKWLYYYLSQPTLQSFFQSIANGTSQHFIPLKDLRSLKVIDTNERSAKIVSILSAYDSLIECNSKRIRLLEQMADNLYKEWFVRFRFPGHQNVKMINGLPEGWKFEVCSSVTEIMSGGTPKTEIEEYYGGEIPFYTPKDSSDTVFAFDTITKITESGLEHCNSQYYPINTLIITARGTVGKINLIAVPMAMNQSCFALRFKDKANPYFLYYSIKEAVSLLKKMANGGVFDTIILKTFDHLKITIPTKEVLERFEALFSPIMENLKSLQRQTALLTRQRDLLLPRLMSGKLEVKPE